MEETHSFIGLPREGFEPLDSGSDWMVRVHLSQEPSGAEGAQRLADWQPPEAIDLFEGAIELKHDDGESDGKQSYGGRGPAIQFSLRDFIPPGTSTGNLVLNGLRIYGSRYGSGYDPETTLVHATVSNSESSTSIEVSFPHDLFPYKAKWVDVHFKNPIALAELGPVETGSLKIAINPHAESTKGIFFHFNENPKSTHSLVGSTERGFQDLPEREWMIRAYLVHGAASNGRQEKSTSTSQRQSVR